VAQIHSPAWREAIRYNTKLVEPSRDSLGGGPPIDDWSRDIDLTPETRGLGHHHGLLIQGITMCARGKPKKHGTSS